MSNITVKHKITGLEHEMSQHDFDNMLDAEYYELKLVKPTSENTKAEIIEYLTSAGITHNASNTKSQLLALV